MNADRSQQERDHCKRHQHANLNRSRSGNVRDDRRHCLDVRDGLLRVNLLYDAADRRNHSGWRYRRANHKILRCVEPAYRDGNTGTVDAFADLLVCEIDLRFAGSLESAPSHVAYDAYERTHFDAELEPIYD